jgi:hypothetical protein
MSAVLETSLSPLSELFVICPIKYAGKLFVLVSCLLTQNHFIRIRISSLATEAVYSALDAHRQPC